MSLKIQGDLEKIFNFINETSSNDILNFSENSIVYIDSSNKTIILSIEETKENLDEILKKHELKKIEVSANKFKANYREIELKELISKSEELEFKEELYIEGKEIVIISPKSEKTRKKVIDLILNLIEGNLSKVTVATFSEGENYLYRVKQLKRVGYLYILERLKKEGVTAYYKHKDTEMYIQMGYKLQNSNCLNINLNSKNIVKFMSSLEQNNFFLEDFDIDELLPLVNTLSFNFDLDKTTEFHAMEYELENIDEKIKVPLSLKKTGYTQKHNLETKINYHKEEVNRLEQIKVLKEQREESNQIVVIKFSEKERLGKLLSVLSFDLISRIKIATIDLGDSLDEKYYILLIDGYHLESMNLEKSYYEETSISLYGIRLYLEDNKYLFPFYAINKEELEISESEYYNLIFGKVKNIGIDIEGLKKEKNLIVILDSSKDIFKTKEMIFIREKDLNKNIIEVYNDSFISSSEELSNLKQKYEDKIAKNRDVLKEIEDKIQDIMEESLKRSGKRLDCLTEEWNKAEVNLNILEKNIEDKAKVKTEKLKNLLNQLERVDDAEKIKMIFERLYGDVVTDAVNQINQKNEFLKIEKESYEIWRNNWFQLELNIEMTKKEYSEKERKSLKKFQDEKIEIEKLLKKSDDLIKEFDSTLVQLNKKYEEIISKYE
ncbi:MAG: hypothetical protein ACRCXT_13240 [Paraclostridium sp.]